MYNSIFIGFVMKIVNFVKGLYRYSFIHKLTTAIKKLFVRLGSGSKVIHFLNNENSIIKYSVLYKVYSSFWKLIESIATKLNRFFKKFYDSSMTVESIAYYNRDESMILRFVYLFMLFSGIGIGLMSVFSLNTGYGNILSLMLFIVGLIGLLVNGYEKTIFMNSKVVVFISDIFRLDDGGEHWW